MRGCIDDSSDDLEEFLNKIYPHPIQVVENACNLARDRSQETAVTYNRLILVGHSEGGVVIRACIAEVGKRLYGIPRGRPSSGPVLSCLHRLSSVFYPRNGLELSSSFSH